jgi:ELWxxDGT repeat protein
MSRSIHAVLVVLSALAALPAAGAGPYLVADLDTTPVAADAFPPYLTQPIEWAELGGVLYFAADDGRHGVELWRTNGALRGTRMVADLCPGPCSSSPKELIAFKGRLAFNATDGFHGTELWLSDGTREGTRMPRDLCPGSCSAIYPDWADPVVVGERLFFAGRVSGHRLGVTDGTAEGTRWLTQPQPSLLSLIGNFKGRLAFSGPGAFRLPTALWLSDGTPEGTAAAVDLCAGQDSCSAAWVDATVVGNRVVFFRFDQVSRMWASDGTGEGTRPLGEASPPQSKILWKGALYFLSSGGLWRSDGTPQGTAMLRAIPGFARGLTLLGESLYFIASDDFGELTLWRTGGTADSTESFFHSAPGSSVPEYGTLIRAGERIVFPMTSAGFTDLWETDGTAAGTRQAARLCGAGQIRCTGQSVPLSPASLGQLYLFSLSEEEHGTEVWALDGAAVRLVRDIARQLGSGRPGGEALVSFDEPSGRDIAALGGRIVFSARTVPQGPARLWASDGTKAGTAEIGPNVPWPHGLVQIGDRLWLHGSVASPFPYLFGQGIWSTDGTAAGTRSVAAGVRVGSLIGGRPGLILFGGQDETIPYEQWTGLELWASNGTAGGTSLINDIWTGLVDTYLEPVPASSSPALFVPFGNGVLFVADDGPTGREPWITDGTAAGTRLLLDINPTPTEEYEELVGWSSPGPFVRFGARAYFAADDGSRGRELWATDGTVAGTVLARDLWPGAAGSHPRDLIQMGTRLFFLADGAAADALWSVSAIGQVTRVRLLAKDQRASGLVAAGSRLFFVVDEPATGPELWTSNGTRGGTHKVRDIRPGSLGSYPQGLTAVNDLLLFAADDGVHGLELWVSNGTAEGTRLLADLAPGIGASAPRNFTLAGDLVAFDADDGVHGTELWAVRKADVAAALVLK